MNRSVTLMVSTSGRPSFRKLVVGPFALWTGAILLLAAFGGAIWASAYIYRIYTEAHRFRIDYDALQVQHTRVTADYEQLQDRLAAIEQLEAKVRDVFELPPSGEVGLIESTTGQGGPDPPPSPYDSLVAVTDDNDDSEGIEIINGDYEALDVEEPAEPAVAVDNALTRAERLLRSWMEIDDKKVKSRQDLVMMPSVTPIDPEYPHWISSGFGRRNSPFTGRPELHGGIDISARTGTPIIAPANGEVVELWTAKRGGALGNAIKIRHEGRDATYETLYGHLRKRQPFAEGLRVGSVVKRHDVIGYVGSTGRTTAPHLHYEVRKDGSRVNPIRYLMDR